MFSALTTQVTSSPSTIQGESPHIAHPVVPMGRIAPDARGECLHSGPCGPDKAGLAPVTPVSL